MTTLSVVLTVKNEEANIKKCLDRVTWADEIIIIDNGSTDNTVKICKQYTKKIYSFPEKTLIPLLQNKGIEKATKEWVLILDADVIVPKETALEIRQRIQNPDISGYYLPHKTIIIGRCMKSPFWTFNILKLFKKDTAYFEGNRAHEQVIFNGKSLVIQNPFYHYSHPTIAVMVQKMNLYSTQDSRKRCGDTMKLAFFTYNYNIFIFPFIYFIYLFLWKQGFRDMFHGFILSILMAIYKSIEGIKIWELKQ